MNKTPVELCGMNTRAPADSKKIVPCVLGLSLLQLQLSPLQLSPLQLSPLLHCPHLVRFPSLLLGRQEPSLAWGGRGFSHSCQFAPAVVFLFLCHPRNASRPAAPPAPINQFLLLSPASCAFHKCMECFEVMEPIKAFH